MPKIIEEEMIDSEEKQARIKKEINRLRRLFKGIDENKKN